jgi:L-threonylcarbamoyladenylate synthase
MIVPATAENIARAARALAAGELVAFPTETVYGLGANARDAAAVGRLFAAKGRPTEHPVIVHLADADALSRWAKMVPAGAYALARAFWPGPLTMILPRADGVLDAVTGGQASVGLRVPAQPIAHALPTNSATASR